MQKPISAFFLICCLLSSPAFAAGLDELSKKPGPSPSTASPSSSPKSVTTPAEKPATPATVKPTVPAKTDVEAEGGDEEPPPTAPSSTEHVEVKPVVKSASSKALEDRLSIGTALGWSIVKPSKGTWIGVGASDVSFRWRTSNKEDSPLYVTGRYAPLAGVWSTGNRDYDTTLHGIYGGADYVIPLRLPGSMKVKGSAELGYMLVYAKAQDGAPESGDVKKGTLNMTAGGGADWSLFSNKLKMGPFVKLQAIGFTVVNVGGSAQFVF